MLLQFLRRLWRLLHVRFVREVLTLQAGSSTYLVASFLSSIVLARLLGREQFGIYAVIGSFVATASLLFSFGQGTSLYVFLTEEHGKKNVKGMAAVLRNSINISVLNALFLTACIFLSPTITHALYGDTYIGEIARILFLFGITDLFNSILLIILQSLRHIKQKVLLEQAANITLLGSGIAALLLGYGLQGIFTAQLMVGSTFLVINTLTVRSLIRHENFPSIRDVLRTPWNATLPYLGQSLLFSVEKTIGNFFPQGLFFLLSLVAQPSAVGIAKIATQLSTIPRSLMLPSIGDLSTTVLARQKSQSTQLLRKTAAQIIKHATALQAAFTFVSMVALPPLVYWFYGAEYLAAVPLALALLLLSLPSALCILNSPLVRLFRRNIVSIMQALVSWVIMIPALLILVPRTGPLTAFTVAYGIGFLLPLAVTAYIFRTLLPVAQQESSS